MRGVPVVPEELTLSLVAVILMLVNGWLGGEQVFRERVAARQSSLLCVRGCLADVHSSRLVR